MVVLFFFFSVRVQITFDCLYELPTFAFRDCMRGGPDAVVQPGEMMDSQDYYTVIFARGSMGLRLRTMVNPDGAKYHVAYDVIQGGQAAEQGVQADDVLVGVNHCACDTDLDHANLVMMLQRIPRPMKLHFRCMDRRPKRVEIPAQGKLGVAFVRNSENRIQIHNLVIGEYQLFIVQPLAVFSLPNARRWAGAQHGGSYQRCGRRYQRH